MVTEQELVGMKANELRQLAREQGVAAAASMRKEQLIQALSRPAPAGAMVVTTDHDVIRRWAEEHDGVPAQVVDTLVFDFGDSDSEDLVDITWDEWFAAFDESGLSFIYREEPADNFFRLENSR